MILVGVKQTRNHLELVYKMNNISVRKVASVVIVSMYVTLTEAFKCCYDSYNTLTALEKKNNNKSVAIKKSQLQLKRHP